MKFSCPFRSNSQHTEQSDKKEFQSNVAECRVQSPESRYNQMVRRRSQGWGGHGQSQVLKHFTETQYGVAIQASTEQIQGVRVRPATRAS